MIILSAEDRAEDTIVPRLMAAGADRSNVLIVRALTRDGGERLFDLNQDLAQLEAQMDAVGGVSLIIIDPITAYLGKKDANKMGDVRGIMAQLGNSRKSCRACVLAINHFNKDARKKATYRMSGSVGFTAAARTVFFVLKDATDESRRIMAPLKNNIAPDTHGFAYSVQSVTLPKGIETSKVVFEGTVHKVTADELLTERRDGGEALKKGKEFLQEKLKAGPAAASELESEAKAVGINETTLRRAKKAIDVESNKQGDKWYWRLPGTMLGKSPAGEAGGAASSGHSTLQMTTRYAHLATEHLHEVIKHMATPMATERSD